MPDEGLQPYRNRSIENGVNDRIFDLDIGETQAVRLQNIDGSVPGQRRLRPGTSLVATGITAGGPIYAMSEFVPRNTDTSLDIDLPTQLLVVAPGASAGDHKQLWYWDGSGAEFTHAGPLTGFTGSNDIKITTGLDLDIAATIEYVAVISQHAKGATFWVWDGTNMIGAMYGADNLPSLSPMAFAFNRGFGVGTNQTRSRLLYSDVGSWTVSGFSGTTQAFEFGGRSRQRIVALHQFRSNELIVFMEDKIEKLNILDSDRNFLGSGSASGQTPFLDWTRETIDPEIGCGARDSVTSVGQDLYFADQFGNIRSLVRTIQDSNQGVESLPISSSIQGTIDRITAGAIKRINCRGFGRFLFVALPVDGAVWPTEVWRLDVVRRAWDGPWTNINPFSMAVATFPDSTTGSRQNPQLYFGSTSTASPATVVQLDTSVFTDPGAASIVYQETTRRHNLGGLEVRQSPQRIAVYSAPAGTVTLSVESNIDGMGFQLEGYVALAGNAPLLPQDMPFRLGGAGVVDDQFSLEDRDRCRDIQFRFTATASDAMRVLGYTYLPYVEPYEWDVVS